MAMEFSTTCTLRLECVHKCKLHSIENVFYSMLLKQRKSDGVDYVVVGERNKQSEKAST